MAREARLWAWLKDQTSGIPGLHMVRVENSAGLGFPDVDGCYRGHAFKLELKGANRPARPTTPVRFTFQPGQVPWITRRWECGGGAWLYARVGLGADVARYLVPGEFVPIVERGVTEAVLASLSIVHGRHDVGQLLQALCRRPDPLSRWG